MGSLADFVLSESKVFFIVPSTHATHLRTFVIAHLEDGYGDLE